MRKSKIGIVLILVTIFIMGTFVSAAKEQTKNKMKVFLTADKEKASIGDIVTLTLDLSQVNYDEFVLTIQADKQIIDNSEINTEIDSDSKNETKVIEKGAITLEKENDVTMKLFASKQNLNSEEIKLCFVVPESLNVGDKINLHATIEEIKNADDNDETSNKNSIEENDVNTTVDEELESESENSIEKNDTNTSEDEELTDKPDNIEESTDIKEQDKLTDESDNMQEESIKLDVNKENTIEEVTITITIVEKTNKENTVDANAINLENVFKEQSSTKKATSSSSNSSTSNKSKGTSSSSNNTADTYKGSSNKYLSNIEVEGYQLTPNFNITNTTYFLQVESDVTKLNISTEKYDSSEIVTIYGNEDLKTGTNKILINVTAEDGSTKTYRIFVTKK